MQEKILNLPANTSALIHRSVLEDCKKNVASGRSAKEKRNAGTNEHSNNRERSYKELRIQEQANKYKTKNKSEEKGKKCQNK